MSENEELIPMQAETAVNPPEDTPERAGQCEENTLAARKKEKRMNLICLLTSVVLFALFLFAAAVFCTDAGTVYGLGFGSALPPVELLKDYVTLVADGMDLSVAFYVVYYMIMLVAWLVIALILIVNLIRAVFGLIGMLRLNREGEKTKRSFLKLQNIAFGTCGSVIAFTVMVSLAGEGLSSGAKILMILTAAVFAVLLVLNAFRKKYEESKKWLAFALDLARDLVMAALAAVSVIVVIGTPFKDAVISVELASENFGEIGPYIGVIVADFLQIFIVMAALAVMKRTCKFYLFDSAKRDVNKMLRGKYISLLTVTLIFWLLGSVLRTCLVIADGQIFAFDVSMVDTWLNTLLSDYLPVLLAAVAGIVLSHYAGRRKEPRG